MLKRTAAIDLIAAISPDVSICLFGYDYGRCYIRSFFFAGAGILKPAAEVGNGASLGFKSSCAKWFSKTYWPQGRFEPAKAQMNLMLS